MKLTENLNESDASYAAVAGIYSGITSADGIT
jgi:hypothetical protein